MGSLVIVHDGLYMKYVGKDVCSAAFVIYNKVTKQRCKGSVVEKSKDADNYRPEILGGVVGQLVLRAASQHHTSPYREARAESDNFGIVNHGGHQSGDEKRSRLKRIYYAA